jgi:ferredoxin--NADP+ reductase
MIRVVLAQPRGFCAGVERAIEIVERALKKYGPPIYVRHEIVHNRHVVEDLRTRGAVFVDELDEVPAGRDLWLLSTGTAIGPFLSMLAEGEAFNRFENLVLVHGVRKGEELSYQALIASFAEQYGERFRYVPFVSREPWPDAMAGRIPAAIANGQLQQRVGLEFSPELSQVLICGNPEMVKETQQTLLALGLAKNLRRAPGNISAENYW